MTDRGHRAFNRARRAPIAPHPNDIMTVIEAYEAELRADLDSDALVERALAVEIGDGTIGINDFGDPYFRELRPDLMREVLAEVLK